MWEKILKIVFDQQCQAKMLVKFLIFFWSNQTKNVSKNSKIAFDTQGQAKILVKFLRIIYDRLKS